MTTITLEDGTRQALPPAAALSGSNCGTPGVFRFDSGRPGPRVAITALIHGNEVCGAHALWPLVQAAATPARGSLTLVFCNLEAYARLDDANKDDRRRVDEDMNRVWGRLDGAAGSYEMHRAREILPFVGDADVLLDLHSMTGAAPALGLVGLAWKNVELARRIGYPALLVRDGGHAAGLRLIDRAPYADANAPAQAMLVECGQHFSRAALDGATQAVARTVAVFLQGQAAAPGDAQSVIEVTEAVTIESPAFEFTQEWPNMAVVPKAGTLIARDGVREIRTPYDDAYLVMPASARGRQPGLTAVRLARRVSPEPA